MINEEGGRRRVAGHAGWDFCGVHVLVTGGTSGIGAAIARAYSSAGAEVTITGTRLAAADYDEDLSPLRFLQMNAADPTQVQAVATQLDRLDILVNNAGTVWPGGLDENEPDVFESALQINLGSAYRLAHACRPLLAASSLESGGCVVGLASMGSYFGLPVVPGYGAAKAGLVQLTKTLAMAWSDQRIRVNAVAAGLTASRMTAPHLADPAALAATLARTPMGRVGRPEDIASAVLFLTSDAAAWITGQTLPVDGGYSIA